MRGYNDDRVHWCIYASPGHSELIKLTQNFKAVPCPITTLNLFLSIDFKVINLNIPNPSCTFSNTVLNHLSEWHHMASVDLVNISWVGVIACHLFGVKPYYYLNQCWLIINHNVIILQTNFNQNLKISFNIMHLKMSAKYWLFSFRLKCIPTSFFLENSHWILFYVNFSDKLVLLLG